MISASRGAAVPSRHRRDSCPSDEVVGSFFFEFEAIRTETAMLRAGEDVSEIDERARPDLGAGRRRDEPALRRRAEGGGLGRGAAPPDDEQGGGALSSSRILRADRGDGVLVG